MVVFHHLKPHFLVKYSVYSVSKLYSITKWDLQNVTYTCLIQFILINFTLQHEKIIFSEKWEIKFDCSKRLFLTQPEESECELFCHFPCGWIFLLMSHWHKQILRAPSQVQKTHQTVSSETIISSILNLPPVWQHTMSSHRQPMIVHHTHKHALRRWITNHLMQDDIF